MAASAASDAPIPPPHCMPLHAAQPLWVRGPVAPGTTLTSEGSIMVMGDVQPGAQLHAAGDVAVWGRLLGRAHAGCQGDAAAQIMALEMAGAQLCVAGVSSFANAKVSWVL